MTMPVTSTAKTNPTLMLPITTNANTNSNNISIPNSSRRLSNRQHRRRRAAAISVAVIAFLLSFTAWLSLVFSSTPLHYLSSYSPQPPSIPSPSPIPITESVSSSSSPPSLTLHHIIFGIAGSSTLWPRRRDFLRLWWRPSAMRGHVWIDDLPQNNYDNATLLPPLRLSSDISRFRYTNPTGHPSGLRISRIVSESFSLGPTDARWFFLCDDDTVVSPDNLVAVLGKYDWTEMVYVGSPSESHSANTYFSHSMAFGGGGIAISYPLAEALAGVQDGCLERYPRLYGSDDRLHACISELGVPLTREYGFHQWDIRGNAYGILAAHPVAPFVSIHHVEAVDPLFPGFSSLESLKLFTKAMRTDPRSFLQRAICYDSNERITFSVSLGYVVQVFPNIILPRELERSEQTYVAWNMVDTKTEFDFDTRDMYRSVCKKPVLFFLKDIRKAGNVTMGSYVRANRTDDLKRKVFCFPRSVPLPYVDEIRISGNPLSNKWHKVPRRLCCNVNETKNETLELVVGECERGSLGSVSGSF